MHPSSTFELSGTMHVVGSGELAAITLANSPREMHNSRTSRRLKACGAEGEAESSGLLKPQSVRVEIL
jgi:hypothetical protein